MRTTTLEEFQSAIRATGGYSTKEECRAPRRAKPGALSTLRYTLGITRVFPSCALAEPLGRLSTERWAEFCFSSVTTAEALGMNVIVEGFENRQAVKGPVLYVANHMSMTETVLLPPILLTFSPFSYVAKASLAHLPFLEKAAEHMRMVPISRVSPREDLVNILKTGTDRIHGGDSFLIFPQGTRCDVFSRKRYSSIGAKLARGLSGRPDRRRHALPADAQDGPLEDCLQGLRSGRSVEGHPRLMRAGDSLRQVEGHA